MSKTVSELAQELGLSKQYLNLRMITKRKNSINSIQHTSSHRRLGVFSCQKLLYHSSNKKYISKIYHRFLLKIDFKFLISLCMEF